MLHLCRLGACTGGAGASSAMPLIRKGLNRGAVLVPASGTARRLCPAVADKSAGPGCRIGSTV